MGKNKKACRNAFYFFMLDVKNRQGRNYKNMTEVQEAAGPLWTNMTAEQRRPFEEMARQEKNAKKEKKYTSLGEDISVIERREQELQRKEHQIIEDTQKTIQLLLQTDQIAEHYFYVIHMNEFCVSISNNRHYPAEIAVSRFNLRNGVQTKDVFHYLINPGKLPLGYSAEAQRISNTTHQIDIDMCKEPSNLNEVFNALIRYLTEQPGTSNGLPALYARERDLNLITETLEQLCDFYQEGRNNFKLYSLEYLLHTLRNGVSGDIVWPTISLSKAELERDVYDHTIEILCEYHKHTSAAIFCSHSIVIRLPYIICDNCCQDLGIDLIPGQHVPENCVVEPSRPPTAASCGRDTASNFRPTSPTNSTYNSVKNLDFMSTASSEVDRTEFRDPENDLELDNWQEVMPRGKREAFSQMEGCSQGSAQPFGRCRRPAELPSALQNLSISKRTTGRGRGIYSRYPTKN